VSGRVGFNCAHDHALVGAFEQIADCRIVAERLDPNAKPGPHDFVAGDKFGADLLRHVNWDGETEPTVHPVDERIHADYFTVDVAERPAAVAWINRCVSLQIIRDRVAAGSEQFVPALAAHHPIGECVVELERRSNGEGKLTYPYAVAVAKLDDRQIFRLNLKNGDIGLLISAHDSGWEFSAISQFHVDFVSALDHMKVRKNITVSPNDETGPFALDQPESVRVTE